MKGVVVRVKVRIFSNARDITRVTQPLRRSNGKPFVKYKKRFWPLIYCETGAYRRDFPPADDFRIARR